LITREQSAFQSLYPQASIQVHVGSSRQAVSALFGATCDMAAVTRELEPEERRAALQGNLGLEGYRFARDALVIIVNRANGVENLTIEDARRIYQGKAKRWSEMGGAGLPVVPVVRPPEADLAAFFGQQVMAGEPVAARVITEPSDSAVVEYVKREPGAIGFVSLGAPLDEVNVLRISSLQGLPYWKPDLEAVYKGDYPLTRFFNLFVRVARPPLANGFITFVTSYDGQKFVRDSGLVPTAVPVRFVRSSPMLSGHRSRRTFPKP
jgi:phosphate transport system substrate-binding protein